MKLFTRRNRKKLMNKLVKIGTLMVIIFVILGSSLKGVSATASSSEGVVIGEKIIGIDLGTTQSVLAFTQNGKTIIIPNEQGDRTTHSIVGFKGNEILVGPPAYNQMTTNSKNTIMDAKRFIGRTCDEPSVKKDMKLLPFDIICKDNKPRFKVNYKGSQHIFSAEEISSMVLKKLKQTAEAYLGEEIKKAVITVPAYFDDTQKAATRDAGTIAGLDVVRIINEPTSAAIAYGVDQRSKTNGNNGKEMNIIVYDLGGGTFDVSLLTLDDGIFEVQANNGDTHLGGEDFDENVLKFMIKRFKKKTGIDIKNNERALSKLRKECEKAKRALSSAKEIKIEIENFAEGHDFSELLTRARFEELNNKLFRSTLKPLEKILSDSGLKKNEIDEIVLVGGSTRIPKIQQLVKDFFNGKEPNRGINPDEAVAMGASIQACIIGDHCGDEFVEVLPIDATSLSLGIETVGEIFTKIIERNTNFPVTKSKIFSTHQDNQESVLIKIFQGERAMVKDNIKLGEFLLSGIAPQPRGTPEIEVKFEIDVNGLLNVEAFDKTTGNKESLTIEKAGGGTLSEDEIRRMMDEAKEREEDDLLLVKRINAKNHFESSVYSLKNKLYDKKDEMNEDDYDQLNELVIEMSEWLDDNIDSAEYDDFIEKQQEFDEIVGQIFGQHHHQDHNQNAGDDYVDHEDL